MFSQPLQQLQQDLADSRGYWQFVPFEQNAFPWWADNPELTEALNALNESQLQELKAKPQEAQDTLAPLLPPLPELPEHLLTKPRQPSQDYPFWLSTGVKGRKWQQVVAFSQQVTPGGSEFLEWCAGKGHLGRLLGWQHQRPVRSVEWQARLCQSGQQQAQRDSIDQHFIHCNVLKDNTAPFLTRKTHAVALHACGDLHITLLHQGAGAQIPAISLSPCCYHLISQHQYQTLSQLAKQRPFPLGRADLRLAVQETVTAGARESRKREQEKFSRILFDLWQRQTRGADSYLPVPSAPDAIIKKGSLGFCQWAAEKKSLPSPNEKELEMLAQTVRERYLQLERMELVQHLYRRALEYYLVLDRCQFLVESGYEVALSAFCERQVTPRNLLITATLSKA
ncbi:methyltransferase [Saliniradius amylolyticus]|nr:methyltransferase [Saliniradius amylolyticus]